MGSTWTARSAADSAVSAVLHLRRERPVGRTDPAGQGGRVHTAHPARGFVEVAVGSTHLGAQRLDGIQVDASVARHQPLGKVVTALAHQLGQRPLAQVVAHRGHRAHRPHVVADHRQLGGQPPQRPVGAVVRLREACLELMQRGLGGGGVLLRERRLEVGGAAACAQQGRARREGGPQAVGERGQPTGRSPRATTPSGVGGCVGATGRAWSSPG